VKPVPQPQGSGKAHADIRAQPGKEPGDASPGLGKDEEGGMRTYATLSMIWRWK